MTKKAFIKKVDKVTQLLKELYESAINEREKLPYYKSYKQNIYDDFLKSIENATHEGYESMKDCIEYFINYCEGYERG